MSKHIAQQGQSLPAGEDAVALARRHPLKAVEVLGQSCCPTTRSPVRLLAALALIDRACGRPAIAPPPTGSESVPAEFNERPERVGPMIAEVAAHKAEGAVSPGTDAGGIEAARREYMP
ncbi:MAG: hypothetical protein ACT4P2_15935 [Pseudomonadota bacterium]